MFSFHKPRIYRSASGCCICRAKSSSSRFTDSRRYEGDFYACFKLSECRTGDICNACVLLVKRWKKLPKGSQRNWHHVVDARAGHGSKPISKINKVKKPTGGIGVITKVKPGIELADKMRNVMKKHMGPAESYMNSLGRAREHSPSACSDDVQMDCISSESGSYHSSLAASPTPSEVGDDDVSFSNSSRSNKKVKASNESVPLSNIAGGGNKVVRGKETPHKSKRGCDVSPNSFLDLSFWKREKTCCGIIFKGPCGEVLLDRRFLSPCFLRSVKGNLECSNPAKLQQQNLVQRPMKSETSVTGGDLKVNCHDGTKKQIAVDCISVDSGYDDSSNSSPDAFKSQLNTTGTGVGCIVTGKTVNSDTLQAGCIHPPSSDLQKTSPIILSTVEALSVTGDIPQVGPIRTNSIQPPIIPGIPQN